MPESDEVETPTVEGVAATPVVYEHFDRAADLQRGLSAKQVSHWLRLSEAELIRLAEASQIPGRFVAGHWRFGALALNDWIEGRTGGPVPPQPGPSDALAALEAMSEAWTSLEAKLEQVIEPLHRGRVDTSSEGQITFAGEMPTIAQLERAYIQHVLTAHGGNKSVVARVLGIDPATLYRKLKDAP